MRAAAVSLASGYVAWRAHQGYVQVWSPRRVGDTYFTVRCVTAGGEDHGFGHTDQAAAISACYDLDNHFNLETLLKQLRRGRCRVQMHLFVPRRRRAPRVRLPGLARVVPNHPDFGLWRDTTLIHVHFIGNYVYS